MLVVAMSFGEVSLLNQDSMQFHPLLLKDLELEETSLIAMESVVEHFHRTPLAEQKLAVEIGRLGLRFGLLLSIRCC